MRIYSKPLVSFSMIALIALAAGVVGYRFGASSFPGVMAQTQTASQSVTTSRDSYADVVDRVAPAVVTIRSARRVRAAQQLPFLDDPFFRQFFGDRNRDRSKEDQSLVQRALGSGVIVTADPALLLVNRNGRSLFLAVQPR